MLFCPIKNRQEVKTKCGAQLIVILNFSIEISLNPTKNTFLTLIFCEFRWNLTYLIKYHITYAENLQVNCPNSQSSLMSKCICSIYPNVCKVKILFKIIKALNMANIDELLSIHPVKLRKNSHFPVVCFVAIVACSQSLC